MTKKNLISSNWNHLERGDFFVLEGNKAPFEFVGITGERVAYFKGNSLVIVDFSKVAKKGVYFLK